MAAPGRAVSLAGELDLLATAAALVHCEVVVTNDSGLLHVAEAVGRPVVALFGPTSPQFGYAPFRPDSRLLRRPPPCSPCSKNGARPCHRPTHACMDDMPPDWVASEVERGLRAAPAIGSL
jgi:ADP-heptose:LPS heptosyltransferase